MRDILVAAALIRRGATVLLVEQHGPRHEPASWALPGGRAEPGEDIVATLRREVREETGLVVGDPGRLLYTMQSVDSRDAVRVTAFVFEVADWRGELVPSDLDGYIQRTCFLPIPDALAHLAASPWPSMHEPIRAYLSGEATTAELWLYERGTDGEERRMGRVRVGPSWV